MVGAPLPFRLKINENIVEIVETEDKEIGTEGKCYIQMSLHCDRSLSETSTYIMAVFCRGIKEYMRGQTMWVIARPMCLAECKIDG